MTGKLYWWISDAFAADYCVWGVEGKVIKEKNLKSATILPMIQRKNMKEGKEKNEENYIKTGKKSLKMHLFGYKQFSCSPEIIYRPEKWRKRK